MLEVIEFIGLVFCAVGVSIYGFYQLNLMSKK